MRPITQNIDSTTFPNIAPHELRVTSLLEHEAWLVVPSMVVIYTLLQALMGLDFLHSKNPVCASEFEISPWVHFVNGAATICFFLNFCFQAYRMVNLQYNSVMKDRDRKDSLMKVYATLMCISVIAGTSQYLTYVHNHGGVCKDPFGVPSPAAQWSEWLVSVPYLSYLACAGENKKTLDFTDKTVIASIALMIVFGFGTNVFSSYLPSFICLVLSTGCLIYFMMVTSAQNAVKEDPKDFSNVFTYIDSMRKLQRKSLSTQLMWIFPYFPLVYLFGTLEVINPDGVLAAYMIGSVVGKLIFSSVLLDSHIKVQENLNLIVQPKMDQ